MLELAEDIARHPRDQQTWRVIGVGEQDLLAVEPRGGIVSRFEGEGRAQVTGIRVRFGPCEHGVEMRDRLIELAQIDLDPCEREANRDAVGPGLQDRLIVALGRCVVSATEVVIAF